jgi:FMN-dependent NADH-azoreductase
LSTKTQILRLDASANVGASSSKKLGDALIEKLNALYPLAEIVERDLNQKVATIDESWVEANFTPEEKRSSRQRETLAYSDSLIAEIIKADRIVLTTPMYNFCVPAALKAWIDLICRAGVTFRYTADGPVGLLKGKPLDLIITTGGVALGSPADFVSNYLSQIFRFIGIEEINIIAADLMNIDFEKRFARGLNLIAQQTTAIAA